MATISVQRSTSDSRKQRLSCPEVLHKALRVLRHCILCHPSEAAREAGCYGGRRLSQTDGYKNPNSPTYSPPYTPQRSPASSPYYAENDPFNFFTTTNEYTFDNSKERQAQSTSFVTLMENLTGCRTRTDGITAPKVFPTTSEPQKISESQVDFFKMLDERIENGPDMSTSVESVAVHSGSLIYQHRGRFPILARSCSIVEPAPARDTSDVIPTRRWSASRMGSAASPTTPTDSHSQFSFIRSSLSPENLHHLLANDADSNDDDDQVKEQYVILGNVYTVTRPRSNDVDQSNVKNVTSLAKLSVTPAMTEEDIHLWQEANAVSKPDETIVHVSKLLDGSSTLINSLVTLTPDNEADEFWSDLDVSTMEGPNEESMVYKIKSRKRTNNSDIVIPGILPLKTVVE